MTGIKLQNWFNPSTPNITIKPITRQAEFLTEVGQPLSMITGYIAEGLFQDYKDISTHAIQTGSAANASPLIVDPKSGSWVGDIKYKDINGDGYVDQNDRGIIGNPWPKFTYNFNLPLVIRVSI